MSYKTKRKQTIIKSFRLSPGLLGIRQRTEPTQEDFQQARDLLRQRANARILDLAKRYQVSKAEELTTVLDAIDSLAEIERDARRLSE